MKAMVLSLTPISRSKGTATYLPAWVSRPASRSAGLKGLDMAVFHDGFDLAAVA
jgi:hypothetical protein